MSREFNFVRPNHEVVSATVVEIKEKTLSKKKKKKTVVNFESQKIDDEKTLIRDEKNREAAELRSKIIGGEVLTYTLRDKLIHEGKLHEENYRTRNEELLEKCSKSG